MENKEEKMKHIKYFVLVLFVLLAVSLTGCADRKSPASGYLSETELMNIIDNLEDLTSPKEIEVVGYLNYFNLSEDKLGRTVEQVMTYKEYPSKPTTEDSKETNNYIAECASYYLRLPMHITKDTWKEVDTDWAARYQLESKLYRPSGMDKIYYYARPEGGFTVKLFGVNKELKISNYDLWNAGNADDLVDLLCSGKWNITVEYDAAGYLVKEEFATVNAPKNKNNVSAADKSKCCYGQATYEYF